MSFKYASLHIGNAQLHLQILKHCHILFKCLLSLLSLAHVTSILYIAAGKSCLQRSIQAGLPCIRENGSCKIFSCHVTFSRIPCFNEVTGQTQA